MLVVRRAAKSKHTRIFLSVCCAALALLWARSALFWARYEPPRVSVRWAAAVTASTREALEARYRLTGAMHDTQQTWSYRLADTNTRNIRGLVQDAAVADTHNIDRGNFQLTGDGRPVPPFGPRGFLYAMVCGFAAALLAGWVGHERLWRAAFALKRAAAAATGATVAAATRGVPEMSADALGFFRFFYAAFLFLGLVYGRLVLEAGRIPDDGQLGWRWLGWMASRPDLMALIENVLLVSLIFFAIGLYTRVAYAVVALGMTAWILVWIESQHSNAHGWLPTLVMVVCLIPVPWGAGLSVDEAIRRRRGRGRDSSVRGKIYGYAVWLPGLILGTVWASAAYSKLESSGPAWILGGAVKYHWVIDAATAPVDWGLWVASHHWAAVVMSFCGVFFEAIFIVSVFLKPGPWRAALASTGLALLVGFYLFHNVHWWTWWLVLLSFIVPWAALLDVVRARVPGPIGGRPDPHIAMPLSTRPRDLQPIHLLLAALVCVHAAVMLPAGFGRFGSYSGTYASTNAFDKLNPLDPIDRVWAGYRTATPVEVESAAAIDAILRLAMDEPLPPEYADGIRPPGAANRLFGDGPRHLTLTRNPTTFDWQRGRFNPPGPTIVIGTLDLDSMALVNDGDRSR